MRISIPESSAAILSQLNTTVTTTVFGDVKEYSVNEAKVLFARIDMEQTLKEINEEKQAELKKAEAQKTENTVSLAQIGIEDFAKVELKTAKVIACEPIKKAKKLLKLTLNDGSGKDRIVASGIAKWYKPEDLIGHTVIVVSNLKPAVLCGVESNGMILAADCPDKNVKVIFADDIPEGCKIR